MIDKQELLRLYNLDLEELLKISSQYIKNEVEFCSLINAEAESVLRIANTALKVLIIVLTLSHTHLLRLKKFEKLHSKRNQITFQDLQL